MTLTDDWEIGPRNRWAYQHVGGVVPTVRDDPRAVGWGSQWRLPGAVLAARGVHGQLVAVDRGSSTVTVMLSSWPAATDQDAEAAQFALIAHPLA